MESNAKKTTKKWKQVAIAVLALAAFARGATTRDKNSAQA